MGEEERELSWQATTGVNDGVEDAAHGESREVEVVGCHQLPVNWAGLRAMLLHTTAPLGPLTRYSPSLAVFFSLKPLYTAV